MISLRPALLLLFLGFAPPVLGVWYDDDQSTFGDSDMSFGDEWTPIWRQQAPSGSNIVEVTVLPPPEMLVVYPEGHKQEEEEEEEVGEPEKAKKAEEAEEVAENETFEIERQPKKRKLKKILRKVVKKPRKLEEEENEESFSEAPQGRQVSTSVTKSVKVVYSVRGHVEESAEEEESGGQQERRESQDARPRGIKLKERRKSAPKDNSLERETAPKETTHSVPKTLQSFYTRRPIVNKAQKQEKAPPPKLPSKRNYARQKENKKKTPTRGEGGKFETPSESNTVQNFFYTASPPRVAVIPRRQEAVNIPLQKLKSEALRSDPKDVEALLVPSDPSEALKAEEDNKIKRGNYRPKVIPRPITTEAPREEKEDSFGGFFGDGFGDKFEATAQPPKRFNDGFGGDFKASKQVVGGDAAFGNHGLLEVFEPDFKIPTIIPQIDQFEEEEEEAEEKRKEAFLKTFDFHPEVGPDPLTFTSHVQPKPRVKKLSPPRLEPSPKFEDLFPTPPKLDAERIRPEAVVRHGFPSPTPPAPKATRGYQVDFSDSEFYTPEPAVATTARPPRRPEAPPRRQPYFSRDNFEILKTKASPFRASPPDHHENPLLTRSRQQVSKSTRSRSTPRPLVPVASPPPPPPLPSTPPNVREEEEEVPLPPPPPRSGERAVGYLESLFPTAPSFIDTEMGRKREKKEEEEKTFPSTTWRKLGGEFNAGGETKRFPFSVHEAKQPGFSRNNEAPNPPTFPSLQPFFPSPSADPQVIHRAAPEPPRPRRPALANPPSHPHPTFIAESAPLLPLPEARKQGRGSANRGSFQNGSPKSSHHPLHHHREPKGESFDPTASVSGVLKHISTYHRPHFGPSHPLTVDFGGGSGAGGAFGWYSDAPVLKGPFGDDGGHYRR